MMGISGPAGYEVITEAITGREGTVKGHQPSIVLSVTPLVAQPLAVSLAPEVRLCVDEYQLAKERTLSNTHSRAPSRVTSPCPAVYSGPAGRRGPTCMCDACACARGLVLAAGGVTSPRPRIHREEGRGWVKSRSDGFYI